MLSIASMVVSTRTTGGGVLGMHIKEFYRPMLRMHLWMMYDVGASMLLSHVHLYLVHLCIFVCIVVAL